MYFASSSSARATRASTVRKVVAATISSTCRNLAVRIATIPGRFRDAYSRARDNYQIPGSAIVFGLETEFGALHLNGSSSFAGVSPVGFASNLVADTTIGHWYNATTARLGWAWQNVLFYGKGGFAISTIESMIVDTRGALTGTGKKDVFGWAWGGGLEYAFASRWSVKAEYLWLGLNTLLVSVRQLLRASLLRGYPLFEYHHAGSANIQGRAQLLARCWPCLRKILAELIHEGDLRQHRLPRLRL